MSKKNKKHKIVKKHQRNGKKKTDWTFWLNVVQTALAIYNNFFK